MQRRQRRAGNEKTSTTSTTKRKTKSKTERVPHEEETDCQSVCQARAQSSSVSRTEYADEALGARAKQYTKLHKLVKKASYDLCRTFEYVGGGAGAVFHHELRAQIAI